MVSPKIWETEKLLLSFYTFFFLGLFFLQGGRFEVHAYFGSFYELRTRETRDFPYSRRRIVLSHLGQQWEPLFDWEDFRNWHGRRQNVSRTQRGPRSPKEALFEVQ